MAFFFLFENLMANLTDSKYNETVDTGTTFLVMPLNGTTAATPFNCKDYRPFALVTYTGFLACTLSFQTLPYIAGLAANPQSVANSDLLNLCNFDGTDYTVAAQADRQQIPLDPAVFCNVQIINITSSVTQTTAGNIMLVCQPIWLNR